MGELVTPHLSQRDLTGLRKLESSPMLDFNYTEGGPPGVPSKSIKNLILKDSNVSFGGSDRILGRRGSGSSKNLTEGTTGSKDLKFKTQSRFGPKVSEKNPDQIPTDRFSKSSGMSRTDSDEKPNKIYRQVQHCPVDSRRHVANTKRQSKVI
jgi:hypothetical protein